MADFVDADLNGAVFERVDLRSARFDGSGSTAPGCATST
jgi:uncharacterized protein YjbI with pentapeptide repeats